MRSFDRYIALGDSISIGVYPYRDLVDQGKRARSPAAAGATSLFYSNDDDFWPEFRGRDLRSLFPELRFNQLHNGSYPQAGSDDLTADCETTERMRRRISDEVTRSSERTLVTITIGGNDLLALIGYRGSVSDRRSGESPAAGLVRRLHESIEELLRLRPDSLVLPGTVYDPSDGTNVLPFAGRERLDREAEWLRTYNESMHELARADRRVVVADIHRHFLGRGLSVPQSERWYWSGSIIEPSARGASEVRRVWLDAIEPG